MICPNCGVDKESTLASAKALLKERDELRDRVEQLEAERDKLLTENKRLTEQSERRLIGLWPVQVWAEER